MGVDINTYETIAIFNQWLVLNTCFSVLCSAADTVSWFLWSSITQHTYTFLVSATENLEELLVFLADHLLQSVQWLQSLCVVYVNDTPHDGQMSLTERLQTHQTGLDGFVFSSNTDVTLYISSSSVTVSRTFGLLQFLHHFSQHGVSS